MRSSITHMYPIKIIGQTYMSLCTIYMFTNDYICIWLLSHSGRRMFLFPDPAAYMRTTKTSRWHICRWRSHAWLHIWLTIYSSGTPILTPLVQTTYMWQMSPSARHIFDVVLWAASGASNRSKARGVQSTTWAVGCLPPRRWKLLHRAGLEHSTARNTSPQ